MIADTIDSLMQRLTVLKQATLQQQCQPLLIQGQLIQLQCELVDLESQIKTYLDAQK